MSIDKITSNLKSYLQKNGTDSNIEVVIELIPISLPAGISKYSRNEKIAIHKEKFNEELESVSKVIAKEGGAILDTAWINQTIKASIPAKSIETLAGLQKITAIDMPDQLTRED